MPLPLECVTIQVPELPHFNVFQDGSPTRVYLRGIVTPSPEEFPATPADMKIRILLNSPELFMYVDRNYAVYAWYNNAWMLHGYAIHVNTLSENNVRVESIIGCQTPQLISTGPTTTRIEIEYYSIDNQPSSLHGTMTPIWTPQSCSVELRPAFSYSRLGSHAYSSYPELYGRSALEGISETIERQMAVEDGARSIMNHERGAGHTTASSSRVQRLREQLLGRHLERTNELLTPIPTTTRETRSDTLTPEENAMVNHHATQQHCTTCQHIRENWEFNRSHGVWVLTAGYFRNHPDAVVHIREILANPPRDPPTETPTTVDRSHSIMFEELKRTLNGYPRGISAHAVRCFVDGYIGALPAEERAEVERLFESLRSRWR
jgi:hypothetical protein